MFPDLFVVVSIIYLGKKVNSFPEVKCCVIFKVSISGFAVLRCVIG